MSAGTVGESALVCLAPLDPGADFFLSPASGPWRWEKGGREAHLAKPNDLMAHGMRDRGPHPQENSPSDHT
jgi:hypothetical protein